MGLIRYKIVVTGTVQGVGFRYATKKQAKALGIKGYVKNTYDGNVEIEAEADESKLQLFIKWCHIGPPMANVKMVNTSVINTTKGYTNFDIKASF